jgi:hypothetical protein
MIAILDSPRSGRARNGGERERSLEQGAGASGHKRFSATIFNYLYVGYPGNSHRFPQGRGLDLQHYDFRTMAQESLLNHLRYNTNRTIFPR